MCEANGAVAEMLIHGDRARNKKPASGVSTMSPQRVGAVFGACAGG